MSGISKRRVERILLSNGVSFGRTGNRRIVWLSDIERALPSLVDGIRFRRDGE